MKKKTKTIVVICCAVIFAALAVWTVWDNAQIETVTYKIENKRIPDSFNGYRIVQVSDLHNEQFGEDNIELLDIIKDAEPDIIALTGDMIDSYSTNLDVATDFIKKAADIAPCFYVTGNHETRISEYDVFKESLIDIGVEVLECESVELERGDDKITLFGIDDPSMTTDYDVCGYATTITNQLSDMNIEEDDYTILLSHRPEHFEVYAEHNIDLVLSGHAHGGQFRLPFVGGIFAPDQGLFPRYDAGLYSKDNTDMVVSTGIGNSIFPFRFNNRPQVVLINLSAVN